MADPLIGKVLGDYQIQKLMGQGGMARVYQGYDPKLQRYAAVKVTDSAIVPEELQDEYEARFIREARAIARLSHPNIVGVYQFDQQDGLNFMAMHFIEGQDLRHMLQDYYERELVMPDEKILSIIRDIAAALDYAHANGVIHRDIKPSNIMVTPRGQAILTDFGLALSVPEGTVGKTFGSAHYIAPEQAISSAKSVPQSDLYSLGVVLYEMATGKVPFDDPSTMSIALMHLNDPPPLPSSINPNINPRLEAVILQLLRKNPEDRYPNGTALVQALLDAFAEPVSYTHPADSTNPLPPLESEAGWDDLWDEAPVEDRATLVLPQKAAAPAAPPKKRRGAAGRGLLVLLLIVLLAGAALVAATRTGLVDGSTLPVIGGLLAAATPPGETAALDPTLTAAATPTEPAQQPSHTPSSEPLPTTEAPQSAATQEPTATPIPPTETAIASALPTEVETGGDLLLIYDADTIQIINVSGQIQNIQPLEFRRANPEGGPDIFFKVEDLRSGVEPPRTFGPDHCFHLIRMDLEESPDDILYDETTCAVRVGWRLLSSARWFWIAPEPEATFAVLSAGQPLTTCEIAAGRCAITLP